MAPQGLHGNRRALRPATNNGARLAASKWRHWRRHHEVLLLQVSLDVGLSGRHVDRTDAPNLPTVDPAVFFGRCDKPDVFVQIDDWLVLAGRRYSADMRCDPLGPKLSSFFFPIFSLSPQKRVVEREKRERGHSAGSLTSLISLTSASRHTAVA